MKKTGVVAVFSHLFEMVEVHCYWVTYVWAKKCDIWEFRDRRAEQWQLVISYSQLDTL